ncbi:MAG: V-type ATP synthase subunit E [Sphaerochaetaceae bacterium]|nr:V-type ATP synthase subunit E [Sphaerochaetaceae bacterium]
MELQINDLVSSIRKEGIEEAKKEASSIISDAQQKAEDIIKSAKEEASKILSDAETKIETLKQSAKAGAKQAERDALLSFRKEVENQFKRILTAQTAKVLKTDALASLIKAAIQGEDVSKLNLEIAEADSAVKSQLADEIKKGLKICPVSDIEAGFRVAAKDGSGFFDCTDEEIAEVLAPFFNELNI